MELNRLRPYRISRLSEIFALHLRHLMQHMTRFYFTEAEYKARAITYDYARLRRCIWQTIFNWSVLVAILFIAANISPRLSVFNRIFEQMFNVVRFDIFCLDLIAWFTTIELFWVTSLCEVVAYRDGNHKLLFEYQHRLDEQLSPGDKQSLIRYFIKRTYLAGLSYKGCVLGMFEIVLIYGYLISGRWSSGQVALDQALFCMAVITGISLHSATAMAILFVIQTHIYFMLEVFHLKLHHLVGLIKAATGLLNRALFERFHAEYIRLHRDISLYNNSVKDFVYLFDLSFKCAGSFAIIFHTKQKHFSLFVIILVSISANTIGYIYYNYSKLSEFPAVNLLYYKHIASMSARSQLRYQTAKDINTWSWPMSRVKQSHRLNVLLQLMAQGQFGFTSGRFYLITKFQFVQLIIVNLYVLILLSGKL